MPPVRVMLVDDMALVRSIVGRMLSEDPDIELVGTAANGREALDKLAELKPDVVVMDVAMPVLDGLTTLRRLMRTQPVPVVMLSARTREGSWEAMEALALGAVDFVPKPSNIAELPSVMGELAVKIKTAAGVSLKKVPAGESEQGRGAPERARGLSKPAPGKARRELVVIGCSTGGPAALQTIIPAFPADLPAAVVVVQHMPAGFTGALSEHLAKRSMITVKHAVDGDLVLPGQVLIAPAGSDFYFDGGPGKLKVSVINKKQTLAPGSFCPSVDGVMISAAEHFGEKVLGVLLTGMGRDGALGMREIKKRRGRTIVEAEESCVVFGMPRAALELGVADKVVPLQEIAQEIIKEL